MNRPSIAERALKLGKIVKIELQNTRYLHSKELPVTNSFVGISKLIQQNRGNRKELVFYYEDGNEASVIYFKHYIRFNVLQLIKGRK